MKKKVLLIGVGLIGGSIALAIKKEHSGMMIIGHDKNEENCRLAQKMNIIDAIAENWEESAPSCDFIILACPVETVEEKIAQLEKLTLKNDVIITDVGSTKATIMKKAACLQGSATFIGGHPMAGSHKSGPGSARAHLFENAYYVLTPDKDGKGLNELKELLMGTGANFVEMEPEEHDLVTGIVSHLPHVIATSLVRQVETHAKDNEWVKWLAAGGFRDITRIASSSPEMWRDVVKHNQASILTLLNEWMEEMHHVKEMVMQGEKNELFHYFAGAKNFRDTLPVRAKGAIDSFYDLYVDVLDKPGVISHVTTILARQNISLTNIRILEVREDVLGVLRISFQTEEDRKKARVCLESHNYETYISM